MTNNSKPFLYCKQIKINFLKIIKDNFLTVIHTSEKEFHLKTLGMHIYFLVLKNNLAGLQP